MKNIITLLIIGIILLPSINAAPSINTVSPITTDGQTATVSGLNFGSNPGLNGITWWGGSDVGGRYAIEDQPIGFFKGTSSQPPNTGYLYSNAGVLDQITSVDSWSGNKAINFESTRQLGQPGDTLAKQESTLSVVYPQDFGKVFVSYWQKIKVDQWPATSPNLGHKWGRLTKYPVFEGCVGGYDHLRSNRQVWAMDLQLIKETGVLKGDIQSGGYGFWHCGALPVPYIDAYRNAVGVGYEKNSNGAEIWRGNNPTLDIVKQYGFNHDTWERVEVEWDYGTIGNYDGKIRFTVIRPQGDFPGRWIGLDYTNVKMQWPDPGYPNGCNRCAPGMPNAWAFYNYWDSAPSGESFDVNVYVDDFFMQVGSAARVELCDSPDWTAVTKCEIQNPTSWNTDGITFEVNYGGSFVNGQTAYLFVIDDQRGVNPVGELVTLGEQPTTPTLFNVNGVMNDGGSVTVSGALLGTHTLDVEWTGDWIEGNAPNTKVEVAGAPNWGDTWGSFDGSQVSSNDAYSGSNSIYTYVGLGDGGVYCNSPSCWQGNYEYDHGTTFDEIYISYYAKPVWITVPPNNNFQWKMWRVNDVGPGWNGDNAGEQMNSFWMADADNPSEFGVFSYSQIGCNPWDYIYLQMSPRTPWVPTPSGGSGTPFDYFRFNYVNGQLASFQDTFPQPNKWNRMEIRIKASDIDTFNGEWYQSITREGEPRKVLTDVTGFLTHQSYQSCFRDNGQQPWQYFMIQNFMDADGFIGERGDIYVDDIYLQFGTQARIELCNNQDRGIATACEIQIPTAWDTNSISFDVNFGGSFSENDSVFLFVITDNGSVSNGFPVTLGSGGGTPPTETCFDNILNQDEFGVDCGGLVCAACVVPPVGDQLILQNGLDGYAGQVDACLKQSSPDTVFGSGGCSIMRSQEKQVVRFDLSSIPLGKTVLSAVLSLQEKDDGLSAGALINAFKLNTPWDVSLVTWNSPWLVAGTGVGDKDTALISSALGVNGEVFTFDVTSLVNYWLQNPADNNGFVLEMDDVLGCCYTGFGTSTDVQVDRPKLTITFESVNASVFDLDGVAGVGIGDLVTLAGFFGTASSGSMDYDNSGDINILDLIIHIQNWD